MIYDSAPLLPVTYLGNVFYYAQLAHNKEVTIELHEHFVKQTYRNRCTIYDANGPLNLIVPLKNWRNNTPINSIEIAYNDPWQKLHWRSITAAYRSSPYFEFYEEHFKPFYDKPKYRLLIELNIAIQQKILELLTLQPVIDYTKNYKAAEFGENSLLGSFSPKNNTINKAQGKYMQVFENKHGFIANLSVIDLLFNEGPQAVSYLKKQTLPQ